MTFFKMPTGLLGRIAQIERDLTAVQADVRELKKDSTAVQFDVRDLRLKVDEMYPITEQVADIFNFVNTVRRLMKWTGIVCGGLTAIGGLIAVVQGWIPTV